MIREILKFGCVGMAAAAVHLSVVSLLVPLGLPPLWANVVGFSFAFQVSYLGHRSWTFARSERNDYLRLLMVSSCGFALNEILYSVLLQKSSWDYRVILAGILAWVAIFTFLAARFWAFAQNP